MGQGDDRRADAQPRPHRRRRRLELGHGRRWLAGPRRQADPVAAQEDLEAFEAFATQRVIAVSAGGCHSLATTADGAFFSWGEGGGGRLGHGEDLSNQLLPKVEAWAPGQ